MTFLKVIIAVAITAVAVYYGLNLLWPHHSQAEAIEGTYSTAASAGDSNSAMASPAAAASTHDAMSGNTAPVAASTSGNAAATTDIADNSSAPTAGQSEPRRDEQAATQGVQSMTSASASASGVAPTSSSSAAEPSPATAPTAAPATMPAAEPAHEQNAAAMEPSAATTTAAQPAQTASAAAPAQAKPAHHAAPAMKHKPKAAMHTASANTTPLSALPPAADAITAWWTPGSTVQAGQFTVVYAGSAAFEKAIVLLFSNPVGDASVAGQSIHVMGADGKVVSGSWKASDKNPRMLIFSAPAGRYTLVLETSLKDAQGHALASPLSGAVYVR